MSNVVKFRHPDADSKHQVAAREDQRETYESQGWVEVGAKSEDDKK